LLYNWSLEKSETHLIATLKDIKANPQAKALSEGFLSGLALLNQGGDLASGAGLRQAAEAAKAGGLSGFAAIGGGQSRYNTGSHSDLSSYTLLTGLAWGQNFEATSPVNRLTLGAFFEHGNGSYDTYNSFTGAAAFEGDGEADYLGGGLMTRLDFAQNDTGNFYAEGAFRLGRIDNEYNADGLLDALGRSAGGFDSSSGYYGLYLGGGYVFDLSNDIDIDLYAKYFWTRQNGDSITLATGDPVEFDDAESHRLRIGTRFTIPANDYLTPYVGLSYEHEFDGQARASTYGYKIDAPPLGGDSAIAEAGLSITPSADLPLYFDLGVQGYAVDRKGVGGTVQMRFEF
jgi:outer membrane autotransporter protein